MRWEHVLLGDEESGLISVVDGKSKADRRVLPITPRVYALLKALHKDQKYPSEGWCYLLSPNTDTLRYKRQSDNTRPRWRIRAFLRSCLTF